MLLLSQTFRKAYSKRAGDSAYARDILLALSDGLKRDPYAMAQYRRPVRDGWLWIYVSPPVGAHPLIRIAYTIEAEDRVVTLRNYDQREL